MPLNSRKLPEAIANPQVSVRILKDRLWWNRMGIKQDRQQDDIPMGGDRAAMTNLAGKIDRSVSFFGQNMTFVMGFGAFGVMT
jgi:hypothetical protein